MVMVLFHFQYLYENYLESFYIITSNIFLIIFRLSHCNSVVQWFNFHHIYINKIVLMISNTIVNYFNFFLENEVFVSVIIVSSYILFVVFFLISCFPLYQKFQLLSSIIFFFKELFNCLL